MNNHQRTIHRVLALGFLLLAVSGILLGLPGLRGIVSGFRHLTSIVHMASGVLFVLAFAANLRVIWEFRAGLDDGLHRREYLWLLGFACMVWVISGTLLTGVIMSGYVGPAATAIHDAHVMIAVIGTLIVLPHLIDGIARFRTKGVVITAEAGKQATTGRRDFLQYIVGGLLFVGIGSGWQWLNQLGTKKVETMEEFVQCNKMLPAPTPAPESLPPKGGGYTGRFRVYQVVPIPCTTSADWKFSVSGHVEKPLVFSWGDFLKLPRVVQVSDFHCVEGWSVFGVTYEGVRLSDLLNLAGVKPQARYVKFISLDGAYTDALSLEQARLGDVMAAVLIDGKAIPSDLGGPVRLVVPQMFAYKAVKWLGGIELLDAPHKGYWEVRGYPVDGWVKPPRG